MKTLSLDRVTFQGTRGQDFNICIWGTEFSPELSASGILVISRVLCLIGLVDLVGRHDMRSGRSSAWRSTGPSPSCRWLCLFFRGCGCCLGQSLGFASLSEVPQPHFEARSIAPLLSSADSGAENPQVGGTGRPDQLSSHSLTPLPKVVSLFLSESLLASLLLQSTCSFGRSGKPLIVSGRA